MTNYTQSGYPKGLGMLSIPSQAPTELNAPLLMRTDSDRNLSAKADPNPARKTRERVLTYFSGVNLKNSSNSSAGTGFE